MRSTKIQCEVQGIIYDIGRVYTQFYNLRKLWNDVKEVYSEKNVCEWGYILFEADHSSGTQSKPVPIDREL